MNITEVLNITRPFIVFDVETTGLDSDKDRIVELGFQLFTPGKDVTEWRSLINPTIPIPLEVSRIHGITDTSMRLCRRCDRPVEDHRQPPVGAIGDPTRECEGFSPIPTFQQLAPRLVAGFTNCDFGGKNVRFDLRFMAAEMKRAGQPWSYATARVIDADRLEQLGVPRHLGNLYEKYTGEKLADAHQAMADVRGTTVVLCAQLKAYNILPRDLDQLHELQWPGWIDTEGKFKWKNGKAVIAFGKHADTPMERIPSGYWKWITEADFSDEVKEIANKARMGTFPAQKSLPLSPEGGDLR